MEWGQKHRNQLPKRGGGKEGGSPPGGNKRGGKEEKKIPSALWRAKGVDWQKEKPPEERLHAIVETDDTPQRKPKGGKAPPGKVKKSLFAEKSTRMNIFPCHGAGP